MFRGLSPFPKEKVDCPLFEEKVDCPRLKGNVPF